MSEVTPPGERVMDQTLRELLEQYIDEEQRGLVPDLERLSGGDPRALAALHQAVREYHEAQDILGGGRDRSTESTPLVPVRSASEVSKRASSGRFPLSRGGRGGAAFLCLAALFALACGYALARLLWAESHFRPAVVIAPDLSLDRALTSRGDTYGLDPGVRITHVSGQSVRSLPALYEAIDRNERREALLRMEHADGQSAVSSRDVLWVERSTFSPPLVDSDLRLLAADPLATQGVPAGSRVVEVDGQSVRSVEELESIAGPRLGRAMRFAFERPPDGSGVDAAIVTVVEWPVHRTLYLVGAAFGVLGLVAFWLKPRSRSSRGFAFFCLLIAVFWMLRAIPHHYRYVGERQVYLLAMCAFPLATVALLGTFTPLRWSWVPLSRYLIGGGLLSALFYFGSFAISPGEAAVGLLATPLALPWLLVSLALILLGQISDSWIRLRGRRLEADDLQRARALRWASLIAFGPYLLLSYLGHAQGREMRIWLELSVLAFPLLMWYSIQRRNLLQINELLRETMVLTSILVGLRLAYAVLSGLMVPIAESWYPESSTALRAILLGGGVIAIAPLHRQAGAAVRRRFRSTPPNWLTIARSLDDHRASSSSAHELASSFVATVADSLHALDVSLLLRGPGPEGWWLAARSKSAAALPDLESCRALLGFLAERDQSSPLFRDDLIDDLRYRRIGADLLLGMGALSAAVVFPVVLNDGATRAEGEPLGPGDRRLLGVLAVGDRADRRNYSRDELRLAEHLCQRIGHDLNAAFLLGRRQPRTGIAARYPSCPTTIGPFSIEGALGDGGMACVFLGRREGSLAAIKIPNVRVQSAPKLLERFLRERSVLRSLQHPNIVPVLETGWAMGEPYLAMEYYARGTLHDYLTSRSRLHEEEALRFVGQIALGLAAALEQGVIHRDLKPKNIFFSDEGMLKVGDFGLARLDEATTLTSEGHTFGTPAYIAPEVLLGGRADWRCDQYALGISFFEMLLGRRPFVGSTFEAVLYQHVHEPVPSPRMLRPELRESTQVIIFRMLAKSPADRYASYGELLAAISAPELMASA